MSADAGPIPTAVVSAAANANSVAAAANDSKKHIKSDGGGGGGGGGAGDMKAPKTDSLLDRKPPANWSVEEVGSFICSINPAFGKYAEAFERDSVDGPMLLHNINSEWLTASITNSLHRKRIERVVEELKGELKPIGASKKRKPYADGGGGGGGDMGMSGGVSDSWRMLKRNRFASAAAAAVPVSELGLIPFENNSSSKWVESNVYFVLNSTEWNWKWIRCLAGVSDDLVRRLNQHIFFADPEPSNTKWECLVRKEIPGANLVRIGTGTAFLPHHSYSSKFAHIFWLIVLVDR